MTINLTRELKNPAKDFLALLLKILSSFDPFLAKNLKN